MHLTFLFLFPFVSYQTKHQQAQQEFGTGATLVPIGRMRPESAHSAASFATDDDLDDAIAALQSLPDTDAHHLSVPSRPDTRASMVSTDSALSEVHIPPPPPDDGGAPAVEAEAEANAATVAAAAAEAKAARRREAHAQREAQLEREAQAQREADEEAQRKAAAKAQRDAEEAAQRKAEESAQREAQARLEAEATARAQQDEAETTAAGAAAPASSAATSVAPMTAASATSPPDYHAPHAKPGDEVLTRLGITPRYNDDEEYPTFRADGTATNSFNLGTTADVRFQGCARKRGNSAHNYDANHMSAMVSNKGISH